MSRHSRDYVQGLYGFDAVVQRMADDDWQRPTACPGWAAGHVVYHSALVGRIITEMIRGNPVVLPADEVGSEERVGPYGGLEAPSADGYVFNPALFASFDGDAMLGDDAAAAKASWCAQRDDILECLDQAGALDRAARSPWGHTTVDGFLAFAFYDPVVHTWDLATAVGQTVLIEEAIAARAINAVEKMSETKDVRVTVSLAAARPLKGGENTADRLIAFAGRDPNWSPGI